MIRKFALALAALAFAACAPQAAQETPAGPASAEQPAVETPTPETPAVFVGIDGKPLVGADGAIDNSVQEALTASPEACTKAGGSLQPVCRMQQPMCLINFADAGKSCTDGAQCGSGRCTAKDGAAGGSPATGQCAATNDPCGCYTRIEDGVAQGTICVD